MNPEHLPVLIEVVNLFVKKDKRERLIDFFSKPKNYDKGMIELLHDPRSFDEQVIMDIPSNEHTPELIYARLKKLGFQNQCVVISDDIYDCNGRTLPTPEALEAICYNTDSMIFCPVSKIGYYEGHEGWRYILKKPQGK